jgi:peptide/nickel transport system substrate-binding protein
VADLLQLGFPHVKGTTGTVALQPDSARPNSPFADKRVRQAVEHAIDREALTKAKSYGLYKAAYQMGPEDTIGYDPNFAGRPYAPEKARALLKEAGYADGLKTKLIPFPGVYDKDEMVIIQRYLAEVGIQVDIEFLDFPRFMGHIVKGWGPNALLGFPVPMSGGNPHNSLKNLFSTGHNLLPSLNIPESCGASLNESLATPEPEPEAVNRYYQCMRDEATLIPIHDIVQYAIMQKGIHDTGQLKMRHWHVWTPWKLWMEKK